MTDGTTLSSIRVIVSCDASPLGATAIDAAAALARGLDAELKGIFVEDVNLFRTAALPFAQEVASSTAQARHMHIGDLQRMLERQAQAVREGLAQAASALRLPWSFQVVRGPMLASVLDAMRGLDLAVFGHSGRFAARLSAAAPRAAEARRAVMVVFDGSPAAQRALGAAVALADAVHGRLVCALAHGAQSATDLRALARQRIEQHHATHLAQSLFFALKGRDAASVLCAAERYAPSALFWGGVASDSDRAAVEALVDALGCPVVLVT